MWGSLNRFSFMSCCLLFWWLWQWCCDCTWIRNT